MTNTLYFGDNLHVLNTYIKDDSVDLVYLDPPFNSQLLYNAIYDVPRGRRVEAQAQAFEDTWHWGDDAAKAYDLTLASGSEAAGILRAMKGFLGTDDLMAYLAMMTVRLIELRRVLKPTGTLYLHCDPTASHYLKVLLDGIFGKENFRNEISWRRSNPKGLTKINFPNCRDVLLRYTQSNKATFNKVFGEHDPAYVEKAYKYTDDDGRRYRLLPLLNPSDNRPNLTYEFLGVTRVWRWTKDRMEKAYRDGLVVQLKRGAVPQYKKYLDESEGRIITNDWNDILPVQGNESLGYPTQKPLALLERIVNVSSNPGDLVLDPFCGCGTAIHAAQKLGRSWVGIDLTHVAIQIIEDRLRKHFNVQKPKVIGRPKDIASARDLAERDKYQFQWWATWLAGGQPRGGEKRGADRGIDGEIFFKTGANQDGRAIISVKGGAHLNPGMVRDLAGTREREDADIGIFICFEPITREMRATAADYESIDGEYPRIQILTVEQLMKGVRPRLPPVYDTITAAEAARATRRRPIKVATPDELRRQPQMRFPIKGGRTKEQKALPLDEPLLTNPQPKGGRGRKAG